MKLTLIDKDMLRTAIAGNTDASEKDAAHIINTVLLKQRRHHGGECERDRCEHPSGPHPMHEGCPWMVAKTQGAMA